MSQGRREVGVGEFPWRAISHSIRLDRERLGLRRRSLGTAPRPGRAPTVDAYALADDSDLPPDVQRNRAEHVRLKRDDRPNEELELLLECVDLSERPGTLGGGMPAV